MNKAITDGIELMPAPFADGLDQYSRGDGTPGSPTYASTADASFVPADQDFGGALELLKTQSTQRLRFKGETPILPGCYLQVKVRIKAVSGSLPSVRIAAYAARANGSRISNVTDEAATAALTTYGQVVEVSAIVGIGNRQGVDMVWGTEAAYGHFGIDLIGQNGGVTRIDDIEISDISSVFLSDVVATVDVRDFGAVGDGSTDDTAAFEAANSAANGRTVLIPAGSFRLNGNVTFDAPTKFEGTVSMPTEAVLLLRRNYDLPNYIEAFGNEELAFRKAFQALINNSDHESLDLGGRKVSLSGPVDMQATVPDRTRYATRRIIKNGQLLAIDSPAWATDTVTGQATYNPNQSRTLSNVQNIANIAVGSHISGPGVGREIYVRSKNVATGEITMNAPLYDAAGTQNFTFQRFKYLLDFSGFDALSKFGLQHIEFQCSNRSSGIMLAPAGPVFTLRDCFVTTPKDRGVTSIGGGCQGIFIEGCQFLSGEDALTVPNRSTIALNINANDAKIRNNRATRFRHFAVVSGQNHIIAGNHFFQGDTVEDGFRSAGIVLAEKYASAIISENYCDNCFIEWNNERDSDPSYTSGFSFSSLDITSNVFLSGEVSPFFNYIVVQPYGPGHFINGMNVSGNRFRSINGNINQVERVDTTFADLNYSRMQNINWQGNSFHGVNTPVENPLRLEHQENSAQQTWVVGVGNGLPFDSRAVNVDAVTVRGGVRDGGGGLVFTMPFVRTQQGSNRDQVAIVWSEAVQGKISMTVRMDNYVT
ncbi:glycosyl hydrolase family 28-related protein [Sulfitobacter sp. S190]|uniref:glycosyl hydrolase family 28-related protein n=1 Tax=Sulfitobacter sp. S190 TaxID=2867022 RepID=UPI0021A42DCD|nr:glycosyl hydrolase family 28-related protein [Sulfitobacter sp. S190]UWR22035.1 right-handed parallel beta-helix repeat-containing protein [Sulfitobacter sp. S190]